MVTQQPRLAARLVHLAPSQQAFLLLRTVFTVAPILFGLDKFSNIMVHWPQYLAPIATQVIPVSGQQFMYAVGVVEIIAGLLVAWWPRIGSLVVAAWLAGIIINLLLLPGFYDVALRDFGLLVAALALNRLATARHAELRH
ncbi:MAG: DoxX family membrane protein [Actinomycetota bacterium]|nr:DoxX family membrane protein [Actinomycetota bacterium]